MDWVIEVMGELPKAAGVQRQACILTRNMVVRNTENRPLFLEKGECPWRVLLATLCVCVTVWLCLGLCVCVWFSSATLCEQAWESAMPSRAASRTAGCTSAFVCRCAGRGGGMLLCQLL